MHVSFEGHGIALQAIPDMKNKDNRTDIIQIWESEIEHDLPHVFDSVLDALSRAKI